MKITKDTKIELRRVEYSARLSEETNAFAADIYIDGEKAGYATNQGHGGPTDVNPHELDTALNEYAKTLPRIETDYPDHDDPTKKFSYEQSSESIIDGLLEEHLREKDLKKLLSGKIVYLKTGKLYAVSKRGMKPGQAERYMAHYKSQGHVVLNDVPFAEAMALYVKHG